MPADLVLHEGDTLALHRLGDDAGRAPLGRPRLGEGSAELVEVIAVGDLDDMEPERAELVGDGHRGVDLLDGPVDLQAVVVDDDAEVVEVMVAGEHGRLPDLPLLDLAIAEKGVDAPRPAERLGGEGHAHGGGHALAEAAGGHVDARGVVHVGVPLKTGPDVAQGRELLLGEEAPLGENRVEAGRAVALGEDEAVTPIPRGVGRVDVHLLEVQVGHDVGCGERAAGMSGLRGVRARDDALAHLGGSPSELLVGH